MKKDFIKILMCIDVFVAIGALIFGVSHYYFDAPWAWQYKDDAHIVMYICVAVMFILNRVGKEE